MPTFNQRCVTCTWQDEIIAKPFENPPCPTCGQSTERLWIAGTRGAHGVISDEIPGGRVYENLAPHPMRIYSKSELRREMKARGLEEFVRHVPIPGTDKSPHTTSWASVNLEAGRILAERQATTKATNDDRPRPSAETIALTKRAWQEAQARS